MLVENHDHNDDPPPCFPCMEPLRCRLVSHAHGGETRFLTSTKIDTCLTTSTERTASNQEFLVQSTTLSSGEDDNDNEPVVQTLIQSSSNGGLLSVVVVAVVSDDKKGEADDKLTRVEARAIAKKNLEELNPTREELCTLQRSGDGNGYLIRTVSGGFLVACDDAGDIFLLRPQDLSSSDMEKHSNAVVWKMEILSGELCFLSNSHQEKQEKGSITTSSSKNISCDHRGNLSTNDSFGGWEVWRFVEVGDEGGHFWINSWTHEDKVLASNADGKVSTTTKVFPITRTLMWTVVKLAENDHGVLIKSAETGMFLALKKKDNDGEWRLGTTTRPHDSLTCSTYWTFQPANRNSFRIFTNEELQDATTSAADTDKDSGKVEKEDAKATGNDKKPSTRPSQYLSVAELTDSSKTLKMKMVHCTPKENTSSEWKLEYTLDGRVTLRFHEEKPWSKIQGPHPQEAWYLAVDNNEYASTTLTLSKRPYYWRASGSMSGVVFLSQEEEQDDHQSSRLAIEHGSNIPSVVAMQQVSNNTTTWLWALCPCMPDKGMNTFQAKSLSLASLASVVAVASVAVAAAPTVIMWGVGYIGFGSGGIVAGSTAAAMMSAEAIAGGGAIAAGGTVATLQSIGAAGLGVVGTGMAIGGGAVAGGAAAVGATSVVVSWKDRKDGQKVAAGNESTPHVVANRPFAGWQHW